jgi:hypothetical protein
MISLLTDMGVQLQARPSGASCLRVLRDNLEYIEDRLAHPEDVAPPPTPPPDEDIQVPVESTPAPEPLPERHVRDDFFDDSVQCDNSLLAEAHERMVSCVITSFRTDAGLILLENELSMFQEETPESIALWVQTMRNAWSSRLHSKVLDDFCEALDLWVLSQDVVAHPQ